MENRICKYGGTLKKSICPNPAIKTFFPNVGKTSDCSKYFGFDVCEKHWNIIQKCEACEDKKGKDCGKKPSEREACDGKG